VIKTFRAKNYGCLKDVTATLTPLHAFIGPNDSGKSTLLRAVQTVVMGGYGQPDGSFRVDPLGIDGVLEVIYPDLLSYRLSRVPEEDLGKVKLVETATVAGGDVLMTEDRGDSRARGMLFRHRDRPQLVELSHRLGSARMLRLDPDALRRSSKIIPRNVPVIFEDEHGLGLPGVYDAILNQDFEAFARIVAAVRGLFPSVSKLGLANIGGAEKSLEITLANGEHVGTEYMSEGLLYYLAFAALRFLAPTSVILIEEPENGLHPARIADVMRVLREVSQTTQILLATHNPLVINELEPDEVSVVTRTEAEGTKLTLMKDTTNFAKRSSVYALGELWLSFADGVDEAPLIHGRTAP
jgi:predicted ATPase